MRRAQLLLSLAFAGFALAATSQAQVGRDLIASTTPRADDNKPVVVIETSMGSITLELDRKKTPITVDNFLKYIDAGYYDGLVFHRVIQGFMIQGGGMTLDSNNRLVEKERLFPPIKNESKAGLSNVRGTIAMARTRNPNSATSQFFINHKDNSGSLDYPNNDGYTAFGKVIDGMDVVDAIAKVKTSTRGDREEGVPDKPVVIRSVKRKPAP
jgi:peptidyl-prolyl cis-trans isomerase A (cyclophilin A)